MQQIPSPEYIQGVRDRLVQSMREDDRCGPPTFLRIALHDALTWDKTSRTGGANASICTSAELSHPGNEGFEEVCQTLRDIQSDFPLLSLADCIQLAGIVAVELMGGPFISFRAGRKDSRVAPAPGRLPTFQEHQNNPANLTNRIFNRIGLSPREIVALFGSHPFGRWWSQPVFFEKHVYSSMERFSNSPQGGSPRKGYGEPPEPIPAFDASIFLDILHGRDPLSKVFLPVDKNLSSSSSSSSSASDHYVRALEEFSRSPEAWNRAYASAFQKLSEMTLPEQPTSYVSALWEKTGFKSMGDLLYTTTMGRQPWAEAKGKGNGVSAGTVAATLGTVAVAAGGLYFLWAAMNTTRRRRRPVLS